MFSSRRHLRSLPPRRSVLFSCALLFFAEQFQPLRSQRQSDAEIQRDRAHAEREITAMRDVKTNAQFAQNLFRTIDVLAFDKPAIRLLVALLKNPLRRNPSRETVGETAFARDYCGQHATLRVAQAMHLLDGCGQVR